MGAKLGKGLLTALVALSLFFSAAPALASNPASIANALPEIAGPEEAQTEEAYQVTLITGDVVTVVTSPDGQRSFAISPAQPNKLGQHFLTTKEDGNTYIIPDGVDLQKLDRELFNIDYLVDEGYYSEPSLPLLVTYSPSLPQPKVQSLQGKIGALGQETELHEEVCTISTRLAYENISASYNNLMSQSEVEKVWLDKKVHALLNDSVPLVGAEWWWTATGNKGEGEEIAILDAGIDSSHPALDDLDDDPATNDPKVIVNVNFSDDASFDDLYGHGTHCAGIAAGTAAGSNYQGVAPGAQLWNVKVLNQWGSGYESWIISGINFASLGPDGVPETGDEADIISMSLGLLDYSDGTDPMSQAVNLAVDRGVVVAVTAGNDGYWGPFTISSPGVAEKVITVGASDKADILADFSSIGPTVDLRVKPDILAPGVDITSSVPGGGYESHSGTSMATPHVAGAAALLRQYYGDTVSPQFIKDALMYTAKDLDYTVYEQGSGRLDLAWETWPMVGVTPASLSMGLFTSEPAASTTLTLFNEDTSSHDVTLTANLTDVINGIDYSGNVTLAPSSFTVSSGGTTDVTLTIDLAILPASIYGGKVIATVDDGGKTIHAIFGFAKLREVTVHKINLNGESAQGHPVWVLIDSPLQGMWEAWRETDESGNFTFYALDGIYHFVSPNWWHEENQITIWTIAENVAVSSDMTVNLDERDTLLVDFDPNKVGQVAAGKSSALYFGYRGDSWSSRWWYPSSFATRVSPISRFDASFTYSYYPEADFIPDNPFLVNTGEWHNLRYSVTEITDDTTFVADYANLVHRQTGYCVALNGERAEWSQTSWDDIGWWRFGFIYGMDAPQGRYEWLSPDPVRYDLWYAKAQPWGEWYFDGYYSYMPGEYSCRIGCHPLTSGVDIGFSSGPAPEPVPPPGAQEVNRLSIYGPISRDSANNDFCNEQARFSGHITVTQDGEVVLEDDIWDHFYRWVSFEGTPHFVVEIGAGTPLALSRNSYTRLDFTADPTPGSDYRPPRLRFRVPRLNLFGVTPSGEVKVKVEVTDDSPISVNLNYSLDDGDTWNDAGSPVLEGGWYVFNLGELEETFVTIAVDAEDSYGNHIHRNTNRAFRVGKRGAVPLAITSAIGNVDVAFGVNSLATDGFDDDYDIPAPMPPMEGVEAYFYYPDNPQYRRKLATSIVAPADSIIWPLKVKYITEGGAGEVTIPWQSTDIDNVPSKYLTLELQDETGNKLADMRTETSYTFTATPNVLYSFQIKAEVFHWEFKAGWNMFSLPVDPGTTDPAEILPNVGSYYLYTWDATNNKYVIPTELTPGKGYWVLVFGDVTQTIDGTPIDGYSLSGNAGWHMIGSLSGEAQVQVTSGSIFTEFYTWDATNKKYVLSSLEPGNGYWLLAYTDFSIVVIPK